MNYATSTMTHRKGQSFCAFLLVSLALFNLSPDLSRAKTTALGPQGGAGQLPFLRDLPCKPHPFFPNRCRRPPAPQIEPEAGKWRTWVLASGSQLPIPPPPVRSVSEEGIGMLLQLALQRDAAALNLINFWDAGSPSYRWNEIAVNQAIKA